MARAATTVDAFSAVAEPRRREILDLLGRGERSESDLRVGGRWRYVMIANEGFEVAFHGTYREVVPNERIVATEIFEGAPGAPAYSNGDETGAPVTTTSFTEADGRTTITQLVECGTKEVRDAIIGSGMEGGMQEAMDKLEQVAMSLA